MMDNAELMRISHEVQRLRGAVIDGRIVRAIGGFGPECGVRLDFRDGKPCEWVSFEQALAYLEAMDNESPTYFEVNIYGFTRLADPNGFTYATALEDESQPADGFCGYWLRRDLETDDVVDDSERDFPTYAEALRWGNITADWLGVPLESYSIPFSERSFYNGRS